MKKNSGTLAGILSGFFWGIGLTISGYIFLNFNISPFIVSFIHDFLSVIFLAILILIKHKTINLNIFSNLKNYAVVLAAILAGPVGMQFNLYAVKYLGAPLTSSVTAIYPAVAVILSIILLKHKVQKQTIIGVTLIVISLFLQTFEIGASSSIYLGILFALICAFAWASESILSSYAMENNLSPLEALFIRQVTSSVIYLIIVLFTKNFEFVVDKTLSVSIIFLVIFNMASYLLYYVAINKIKPAKATGLNVSYVVWTVLLATIFLNGELTFKTIITSLVIIFGVYIIIKDS